MTGMDGINSLQKMLGQLSTTGNTPAAQAPARTAEATAVESTSPGSLSSTARQSATTPGAMDRTSLSAAGGLATGDTSDVRLTKVAELKAAIASGTYNVSASAVADKMLQSMLR